MIFRNSLKILLAVALVATACGRPADGEHVLTILSTNDIHGHYYDSTYVGGGLQKSLIGVSALVDSVRIADGVDNVVLVDAGDILQGDNAAYYFNYVDTLSEHIYSRMAGYMHYDAVAWGNHDVETGHAVYDRFSRELASHGIPLLAGNAIRNDNGKTYFPLYKMVRRAGLRVAILGYTNMNIKGWLSEDIWSGMHFVAVASRLQDDADMVRRKEKADVVIAVMHTGTGKEGVDIPEAEALKVFRSVRGVDFVFCSHDHRPFTAATDSCVLINTGSHCRYLGEGRLKVTVSDGKVVSKVFEAPRLIPVDPAKPDTVMRAAFHDDYLKVKEFTLKEVGRLMSDLRTADAYVGMSDYINLIHTIQLGCAPARISLAAPLTYNGTVKAGTLIYNDLFTIYPYENQLFVVSMTGKEIRDALEYSYDHWIQTPDASGHVLKIAPRSDARTGQTGWSFINRSYNFDSAGGLVYTVDVTKPLGERVAIESLASGEPFSESETYPVAMTSYRANGGGGILFEGAGIDTDAIDSRIVARYPEIRELLYDYLLEHGTIDPAVTGNPAIIGSWRFVPDHTAPAALGRDLKLLFN
ncbi:MAG: 5'-nucleotidase C-terminal domain-containing protein [Bacteroidales bacterium]|nr:5'-nucleotidase C-terminal domain-containing protein [Bacteroidales bacterium]